MSCTDSVFLPSKMLAILKKQAVNVRVVLEVILTTLN